jgi:hypothetical protein
MEADSPTLPERRQNAIEAVERLLRVAAGHEDADWIEGYEQILDALTAGRDEDAFAIAEVLAYRIPKEPGSRFRLQPRWVVSEDLAGHVQSTLTRLRIHVRYGDRRPLIVLDDLDPDLTSRGTRREVREAERRRDPEEQKRQRILKTLGQWLEAYRRPAWHPVCEERDGPLTASRFAGTPWLAPGERWPTCRSCHRPLALFLQLNLSELPRELDGGFGAGLLQFFYCRYTASNGDCRCEGYEPFAECHLVRVVQPDTSVDRPEIPVGIDDFAPRTIVGWDRIDDYPRWCELERFGLTYHSDSENREGWVECPDIGLISERFKQGAEGPHFLDRCDGSDKLSGWPCWIQDAEYPNCPNCRRPMQMVFQHTGDALPFMFGDMGIGHITQCPAHKEVVAFGWACH